MEYYNYCTILFYKNESGGNNTKYTNTNTLNTDKDYNKCMNAEMFNKHFKR